MTDVGFARWLITLLLVASGIANLVLVGSIARPWWIAIRDQSNGPRTVILRGAMRHRVFSVITHGALIFLFGWRLWTGQPAPPTAIALCGLTIVLSLAGDAFGSMFDYRLLRGLLSGDRE